MTPTSVAKYTNAPEGFDVQHSAANHRAPYCALTPFLLLPRPSGMANSTMALPGFVSGSSTMK